MYEMLGNQLFMSRKYKRAIEAYEQALTNDKHNKAIRRKLIICYCQEGKVEKALQMFLSLTKEDIQFIMSADPILDDCPCPEIIYDLENNLSDNKKSLDFMLIMGMLWLYCDIEHSHDYFIKAKNLEENNVYINSIIVLIGNQISKQKKFSH